MYRCLNRQSWIRGSRELIPLRKQDLIPIMNWRNQQNRYLRTKETLTQEHQERYWSQVLSPQFAEPQPKQVLLSYLDSGQLLGYGGLVHIDWDSRKAEISFLMETQVAESEDKSDYQSFFLDFLILVQELAFQDLKLHRLFLETYDLRPWHDPVYEKAGFELEGRYRDHVVIEGQFVDSLIHARINSQPS